MSPSHTKQTTKVVEKLTFVTEICGHGVCAGFSLARLFLPVCRVSTCCFQPQARKPKGRQMWQTVQTALLCDGNTLEVDGRLDS